MQKESALNTKCNKFQKNIKIQNASASCSANWSSVKLYWKFWQRTRWLGFPCLVDLRFWGLKDTAIIEHKCEYSCVCTVNTFYLVLKKRNFCFCWRIYKIRNKLWISLPCEYYTVKPSNRRWQNTIGFQTSS